MVDDEEITMREASHELEILKHFLQAVESGILILCATDTDVYHFKFASDKFCSMFQIPSKEIMQMECDDLMKMIFVNEYDHAVSEFHENAFSGAKFHFEYEVALSGHSPVWMRANVLVVEYKDQLIYSICCTDITDKINYQTLFRDQQNCYLEMMNLKPSEDQRVLFSFHMNLTKNTCEEIMGPNKKESVNTRFCSVEDFFTTLYKRQADTIQSEQFQKTFGRMSLIQAFLEGRHFVSFEHLFQYENTSPIWVITKIDMAINPVSHDIEGILTVLDIHGQKLMKQALHTIISKRYPVITCLDTRHESYFRYTSEDESTTPVFVEQFDYTSVCEEMGVRYVEKNDDKKFIQDIRTKKILSYLDGPDSEYSQCLKTKDKQGRDLVQQLDFSYLDYQNRQILITCMNISDIISREQEEKEQMRESFNRLKESNEARTAFFSRLSHDMRTPMNGILGLTAMMLKKSNLPEDIRGNLEDISEAGNLLKGLINDVLDMNKIESGELKIHTSPYQYRDIIENIICCIRPEAEKKHIEFITQYEHIGDGIVMIDKTRVQQVLLNLLSNAVKFTPEGGKVELLINPLSVEGNIVHTEFIVRDNGIGISSDFLPKIFEPYQQENNEVTQNQTGTGIGMYIVRLLVEKMGGHVEVMSTQLVGTEVRVYLDLMHVPKVVKQKSAEKEIDLSILREKNILLCEDNALNAKVVVWMLTDINMNVTIANNGEKAIELFSSSKLNAFDMILMDVRMPVMDGLQATEQIRKLDRPDAKSIPIIAITANAYVQDIEECHRIGMNAHIAKPIEMKSLYRILAQQLMNESIKVKDQSY